MPTETIAAPIDNRDAWVCICGNTPEADGFLPCDNKGTEIEPTLEAGWEELYVCHCCGRIIDQFSLAVVGRRPVSAQTS